jgi:starch phosphorylase
VQIVSWKNEAKDHWSALRFGEVRVRTDGGQNFFSATVYLDDIDPGAVAVELYADDDGTRGASRVVMRRDAALVGARGYVYLAELSDARPAGDYTARIVPAHPLAKVPLELPLVTWAR